MRGNQCGICCGNNNSDSLRASCSKAILWSTGLGIALSDGGELSNNFDREYVTVVGGDSILGGPNN